MTTTAESDQWIERWLSAPRYAIYLAAADHDRVKATRLYEWNARVASAFHHDLAHLEIGLRNAYDRALCAGTPSGSPHWVYDPFRFFPPQRQRAANGRIVDANESTRALIADAIRNARRIHGARRGEQQAPAAPGKVIAELGFGFWRYLSIKRQYAHLWLPHLHRVFRKGTSRPDVDLPVGRLHSLRNRVAHHEPLLGVDLAGRHQDLVRLTSLISPELGDYIAANSDWPRLSAVCPTRVARGG